MRCFLLAALLALTTLSAGAVGVADTVRQRLVQAPVLRGEFEQRKTVVGFKKPLVSHGDFLVVRERGVVWRTRDPFASVLKLNQDEIVAKQGGEIAFRLNASQEPSVRLINGLLFALLRGDVSGLADLFQVEGNVTDKHWQLALTPKLSGIAKMMRKVELQGDQYVRRIEIDETNGDHTTILFTAQTTEPPRLTAEEASRFD
ncbi:MAG: outer membrane lipoprotein carrier protein LolA [Burkholderiales bacterium]|nr:outer membrane lipoprotein carrier protein LolA [Burkholderiales bacterium]